MSGVCCSSGGFLHFVAIVPLSGILDGGSLQRFAGVGGGGRIVACNGDHKI
jgi:hypothetical protein